MTHANQMRVLLLVLLLLPAGHIFADGGSAYSVLGLGDLRYIPSVRSAGMGFAHIAVPSPLAVNAVSPAAWGRITRTRVDAGVFYEGLQSSDGINSRFLSRAGFTGGMVGIPISEPNGIVLGAVLTPYSSVDYETTTRHTFPADTAEYLLRQIEDGRMGRASLGLSYGPLRHLMLGAMFDYYFGTFKKELEQTPAGTAFAGGTVFQTTSLRAASFTIGVQYESFEALHPSLRPLSAGILFSGRGSISAETDRRFEFANELDTIPTIETSTRFPFTFGIGAAYRTGERTLIAADFLTQPWTDVSIEGRPPADLRDSWRFGVGFEHRGSTDPNASWLDKCAYRFGFSYNATYYRLNGRGINEWTVTAGTTVPLAGDNMLSVAAEAGSRGTTEAGLIKDTIIRAYVALHISELWFTRPDED